MFTSVKALPKIDSQFCERTSPSLKILVVGIVVAVVVVAVAVAVMVGRPLPREDREILHELSHPQLYSFLEVLNIAF